MAKRLTKQERRFCYHLSGGCSVGEAARRAGLHSAERLLQSPRLAEGCRAARQQIPGRVRGGLERLAFGDVTDAVRLIYMEDPQDGEITELDLFNIAEIKRGKNGVEIKFFDRLKALEHLAELSADEQSSAEPFYRALNESVLKSRAVGDDDEV